VISINLLPWRDFQRDRRERHFYVIISGAALAAIALVIACALYLQVIIIKEHSVESWWQGKLQKSESQQRELIEVTKQRQALLSHVKHIVQYQNDRYRIINLLNALPRIVPKKMNLIKITRSNDKIILSGVASSHRAVSQFVRALNKEDFNFKPQIDEIKSPTEKGVEDHEINFRLILQQKSGA